MFLLGYDLNGDVRVYQLTKIMSKFKRYRPRVISAKDIKAVSDEELESLFIWVDEIPLSRPKRNLSRDFADGGK